MNQNSSVGPKPAVNVTTPERLISAYLGYRLVKSALTKSFSLTKAAAGAYLLYRAATGHCTAYSVMGRHRLPDPVKNINIRATVSVNRPRQEVYAFWRRLENLPLFMSHLLKVEESDTRRSHWTAAMPGGLGTISWKAEIVKEEEDSLLAWNSLPGSTVENAGKVEFTDSADGGTEIYAVISYHAPLGAVGSGISRLINPFFEDMVREDIYRFKEYIEESHVAAAAEIPSAVEDLSVPREGTAPAGDEGIVPAADRTDHASGGLG